MKYLVIIRVDPDGATEATIQAVFTYAMKMHNIKGEVLKIADEKKIKGLRI